MNRHASIEEAIRLLKIAYSYLGKSAPPLEWAEATEKFLSEHRDYESTDATKTSLIVLRPGRELVGKVSKYYNGYWYDLDTMPVNMYPSEYERCKAKPSGGFETRDSDGAIAEIWIVEPNENFKQEGRYY